MLTLDIAGNLLHRTRTIEGDTCDKILKAVRFELLQKLSHAAGFQLEHPVRVAGCNHLIHFVIREWDAVKIRHFAPALFNKSERIANDR